jgi:hypothetical protein
MNRGYKNTCHPEPWPDARTGLFQGLILLDADPAVAGQHDNSF